MTRSPKHILILSSWLPTEQSPFLGNFVIRQVELLARQYKVSLIQLESSSTIKRTTTSSESKNNVQYIRTVYPKKKTLIQRKLKEKKAFELALTEIDKIDLIIGHVLITKGWQFILAKRKFKCPLFYVEHGSYFHSGMYNWRRIDQLLKNKVADAADEIIAVSDFLRQDMKMHFPQKEIKVIGNHVDQDLFPYKEKSANGTPQFLHVSTLDERTKNPVGILKAASLLNEKGSKFHLTFISDENYAKLSYKATELGLQESIEFLGPLNWDELASYYHRADAFILFSDYESFSIVVAEAWLTGTPVVATPVGIAAKMDESLGISVDVGNVHQLAHAMQEIIEGRKFDGKEINKFGQKYSEEQILRQWINLIESYG